MPSLRELRRRIKSVDGIRQITRAMQMVAATKLRRAQQRIEDARPYTDKMDAVLAHLSKAVETGVVHHPLMERREKVSRVMIVGVSSDKGLCGSFNSNLAREVETQARKAQAEGYEVALLLIGRKIHDHCLMRQRDRKWSIRPESAEFRSIDQKLPMGLLQKLTDICTKAFLSGEADRVDLVYTEFKTVLTHKVVVKQFLPIVGLQPKGEKVEDRAVPSDYIFEPTPEKLFSILIPKYARIVMFRMLADSLASEHGQRMNAMRNATDNAAEMIQMLTLRRNKARQAAITKELSEIVGGAEALRG